MVKTILKQPV